MSYNKVLSGLALSTLLLVMSVGVEAKHHGGMHKKPSAEHHQMMMEKLGVNDEQRVQMDKLHQQRMEAVKAHQEKIQELKQQQRKLMQQETLDKSQLQSNLRKQADLKAEMLADKHQHHQQVNKVLTVEQRAKMQELKEQMYEKRQNMREKSYDRRKENRQGQLQ